MDALDRQIIAELQLDGRQSLTELAGRVGLTVSPAHRRVRDLESARVITGYRAMVDPRSLGLGFEALVFVTMKQEDRATLLGFEEVNIPALGGRVVVCQGAGAGVCGGQGW